MLVVFLWRGNPSEGTGGSESDEKRKRKEETAMQRRILRGEWAGDGEERE